MRHVIRSVLLYNYNLACTACARKSMCIAVHLPYLPAWCDQPDFRMFLLIDNSHYAPIYLLLCSRLAMAGLSRQSLVDIPLLPPCSNLSDIACWFNHWYNIHHGNNIIIHQHHYRRYRTQFTHHLVPAIQPRSHQKCRVSM